MADDGFSFDHTESRGADFYYGEEALEGVRRAVERLNRQENAAKEAQLKRAAELSEKQGRLLRESMQFRDSEAFRDAAREAVEFVQDADEFVPKVDLAESPGYQEHPLPTKPGSCVDRYPCYDFSWVDIAGGGLGGVASRPGTNCGNLGGLCVFSIGGSAHVHSGTGFWVYSGSHSGPLDLYAYYTTYGRCALSAFLSYAHTHVRLNAGIYGWTEGRWMDTSGTDIYDAWITIGFTYRDFNAQANVVSARAWVQPNRWYAVWGWENIWTGLGGAASGGSNIWTYLTRVRVCT
jgi:hypothetical protein